MKPLRTAVVASILAAGLAACGDSAAGPLTPDGPLLNGYTFGSGHRAVSDSTSPAVSEETTADDGGAEERGGYTFGSGH